MRRTIPFMRVVCFLASWLLLVQGPLAHACEPDQLWIPGMYDGDATDDAAAVLSSPAIVHDTTSNVGPLLLVKTSPPAPDEAPRPGNARLQPEGRAPPLS